MLDEMAGETVWAPNLPYVPGDVVVRREPVRRSLWEWLTRRPQRSVDRRYICVRQEPQEWSPFVANPSLEGFGANEEGHS